MAIYRKLVGKKYIEMALYRMDCFKYDTKHFKSHVMEIKVQ